MGGFLGRKLPANSTATILGGVLVLCLFGLIVAKYLGDTGPTFRTLLYVLIFAILLSISFVRPLWGVLILVSLLPVERLLPDVSFATSMYPLLGASTLLGYFVQLIRRKHVPPQIQPAHVAVLLFVLWIAASNPHAAFVSTTRIWFFTVAQIAIFMFLVSQLVKSVEDFRLVTAGFVCTAILSAAFAIPQVHFGPDSASSLRAIGLGGGPNGAARIYVVAILFASYYFLTSKNFLPRVLLLTGVAVLLHGLAATVSRTGILLFLLALGLASFAPARKNYGSWSLPVVATLLGSLALIPVEYWQIVSGIAASVVEGTDSIGFRYMQWDAAFQMFRDNMIAGVGIGQFSTEVHYYGMYHVPFYGIGYVAHSLPMSLLSEIGIVGALLFATILFFSFSRLLAIAFRGTKPSSTLAYFVAATLGISILGGTTSDMQFDKLLWFFFGFANGLALGTAPHGAAEPVHAQPKPLMARLATAAMRTMQ